MAIPHDFSSDEPVTLPIRPDAREEIVSPHRPPHEEIPVGPEILAAAETDAHPCDEGFGLEITNADTAATVEQQTVRTAEQIWQDRFGFRPNENARTHFAYFMRLIRHFQRPGTAEIMIDRYLRDQATSASTRQVDSRWLRKRHGNLPLENLYHERSRRNGHVIETIRTFVFELSGIDVEQFTLQDLIERYNQLNWLLDYAVGHPAQATVTPGFFNWFTQRVYPYELDSWTWLNHFRN